MAEKKKSSSNKPGQQTRRVLEQRYSQAEAASRELMDLLFQMERDGRFGANERACQYVNTAKAYYRRLRNGKVMGPADFTAAADTCLSARRTLQALDPSLEFAELTIAAQLLQALNAGDLVVAEFQRVKNAGKTA